MGQHTYGTAHLYGVNGTISNATVTDASFDEVCANMAEVMDEDGNVIERRYDDLTEEGTITLIQRAAYTVPEAGTTVSYNHGGGAATREITKVGRKHTARGHRVIELSVKKSENVAYA